MTDSYLAQVSHWPRQGCHILAQFDAQALVVYQAYPPDIGHYVVKHHVFGGAFRFHRMSWIKPNFLWMMYRSGWGSKTGQEIILAIWLRRAAFDHLLTQAVHTHFVPSVYPDHDTWAHALAHASVLLQWDPDHDPSGTRERRRALQLGLRGTTLLQYAREWILDVEDISAFARQQRLYAQATDYVRLLTPCETVYPVTDAALAQRLGLSMRQTESFPIHIPAG